MQYANRGDLMEKASELILKSVHSDVIGGRNSEIVHICYQ